MKFHFSDKIHELIFAVLFENLYKCADKVASLLDNRTNYTNDK